MSSKYPRPLALMIAAGASMAAPVLSHSGSVASLDSDPFGAAILYPEDGQQTFENLRDALQGGKTWVQFRLRHEEVDDDGFDKKAHASTLRTVLGYETGNYEGWTGLLEFDDVRYWAYDAYNGSHFRPDRPTVADPQGGGLNQFELIWHGPSESQARIGRQKLELDDERFVGDVGWRQNDQTYDAVTYVHPDLAGIGLVASYLRGIATITDTKVDLDGYILWLTREFEDVGTVGVYDLNLDFDAVTGSTNTLGAYFAGKVPIDDRLAILFRAEFANQTEAGDLDDDVDTDYTRGELGAKYDDWTAEFGQETLGGADGGAASFQTPLATKHAFNGSAPSSATSASSCSSTTSRRTKGAPTTARSSTSWPRSRSVSTRRPA